MKNVLIEMHAIVWGRVQGVGFRVTTRHCAVALDLKGIVRNLDDGNVEIIIQGTQQKLDDFIKRLKGEFEGYIARVEIKYNKPSQIYDQFKIV